MTSPLTDEQAKEIACNIVDTSKNVYREVELVLHRELVAEEHDEVYEHVSRMGDMFKCSECNNWTDHALVSTERDDLCEECAATAGED